MKKSLFGLLIVMIFLTACNKEYKVWNINRIDEEPIVRGYVSNLQSEMTERKGFKLFNISNDKKMVVISTGTDKVELEVVDVQINEDETIVTVKEIETNSEVINPYILVELNRTSGKFTVVDEDGEEYEIMF